MPGKVFWQPACAGSLKQDGYKVAPFKSQNMALNSFITEEGLEMGRAQVMQAEAAGIKPSVYMNPILLKPTNDVGSQVIVNGEVLGNMPAREYFAFKKQLIPKVQEAFRSSGGRVRYHRYRGSGQSGGDQSQERRYWSIWGWPKWQRLRCFWWATSTGAAFLPSW